MHYVFNVSHNGRHLFATAEHSGRIIKADARHLLLVFQNKFPKSEGYNVKVTLWQASGVDQTEEFKTA